MDTEFWNSLKVTLVYTLYTVPGKLVMALAVAVFLNRDIKGINLIRTLYYIPSLFGGSVAVALLWKIMFMDNGVINAILTTLHLPNVQWLGDPRPGPAHHLHDGDLAVWFFHGHVPGRAEKRSGRFVRSCRD